MKCIVLTLLLVTYAYGHPSHTKAAEACKDDQCSLPDCKCSSTQNPINNPDDPAPQLLAITVSESIVQTLYNNTLVPLFYDEYLNPDGNPIGLTLYVNHEYTDYRLVSNLYNQGFEIGVHSITKNSSQEYWRTASKDDLVEEFAGQRQIISKFANIPIEDLIGVRTPQLQLENDVSFDAYTESELQYDNSWPTVSADQILPYTLDFASSQDCLVSMSCPVESHSGFWVAPITNIRGVGTGECNSLATCNVTGSAQDIADWLLGEVDFYKNNNRAPMVLRLDSYWFEFTKNSFEGFQLFLEQVTGLGDVYLVTVSEIINWIKNPVPASQYQSPYNPRDSACQPVLCSLPDEAGVKQNMGSCVPCPEVYPWKGNPNGDL